MKSLCCFSNKSEEHITDGGVHLDRPLRTSNSFHFSTPSNNRAASPFFSQNRQRRSVAGTSRLFNDITDSPQRSSANFSNGRAFSFVQSISPFRESSGINRNQNLALGPSFTNNANPPYQNLLMRNISSPQGFAARSVDDDNVLYSILPNSRSAINFPLHHNNVHSPSQLNSHISHAFASPQLYASNHASAVSTGSAGPSSRFCHCDSSNRAFSDIHYQHNGPQFRFLNGDAMPPKIFTQREYIHYLIPDQQSIVKSSFYWGKMDRHEAELLLNGKAEGAFLLRDSVQDDFTFSISFRRYSRTLHARIEQHKHHFSLDSHDPNVYQSRTINGLLEHYKVPESSLFFEPLLTLPQKRKQPFTLKALARAAVCDKISYDAITFLEVPAQLKDYLREYNYKQVVSGRRFDPHHHHMQCFPMNSSNNWMTSHACHVTASPFGLHQSYTPGVFSSPHHGNPINRANFSPQSGLHQPAFSPTHRPRGAFYYMSQQRPRCTLCPTNTTGGNNPNNYSHNFIATPPLPPLHTLTYNSPNNAD